MIRSQAPATKEYTIRSEKLKSPHRYVFLSDIHSCEYENDNEEVLRLITDEKPEAILLGGDTIIAREVKTKPDTWLDVIYPFLKRITSIAPVYAAEGNHEQALRGATRYYPKYVEYYEMMEKLQIRQLINRHVSLNEAELFGLRPNDVYYKKFRYRKPTTEEVRQCLGDPETDRFSIVLSHHPRFFDALSAWGADLVLSGHFHGGLIRVGKQGLISPEPVLFPSYSGGRYEKDGTTMIVNCGLGTHTFMYRIGNPGEVTVLDLQPA
ncbi:MAG: metallophosphoesterase [Lachnospiraceae bacterium]|nr:metallophosphoesterase [Lachnospiraceae bacterium]